MPDVSVPAPVGGWNARDSVEQMDPVDAIQLINLIPGYQGVSSRQGSVKIAEVADMVPGEPVETLAAFEIGSINTLIAGTGGMFWSVPSDILIAPTLIKDGSFTRNRWQHTHHSQKMIFTNGGDTPQVYDGTTMVDADFTGTDPGVNLDPTKLWGCNTYKGRVWYWEEDSQRILYADIGSFQGELKEYPLGQMLKFGGTLTAMITWTNDAGEGIDDMAVFVTSTGETLIYQGDNPNLATEWEMVGRFFLGEPMGIRAHANIAGETILATRDGYVNLSVALAKGRIDETANISAPIIRAAKDAADRYGNDRFGWECTLFPAGSLFVVNVPVSEHVENPPGTVISEYQAEQHVMNTNTGRWCQFQGWNALTFTVFDDDLHFATRDGVYRVAGANDHAQPITYQCITAFSPLADAANRKQVTAAALVTNFEFPSFIQIKGMWDFKVVPITPAPSLPPERVPAEWDVSEWDEYYWGNTGTPVATRATWQPVKAFGYQVALGIALQSRAQRIVWYSTKVKFLQGSAV